MEVTIEQIRAYRLRAHHLDKSYKQTDIIKIVSACGLQNAPPTAWESALFHRIPDCTTAELHELLYHKKTLVQAWGIRGIPMIFPTDESSVFLSALQPKSEEPWIYTKGIKLALDHLQISLQDVLDIMIQVMPNLDQYTIKSKITLDQTFADWMEPLLPKAKQILWKQPSMYGNPNQQTVGGAVVSFLLRPCSFRGLIVFGERKGAFPTFTSYQTWIGQSMKYDKDAEAKLLRKYLHCYGPSTIDDFSNWLGCSKQQAMRMWDSIHEEMVQVIVEGKSRTILKDDQTSLCQEPIFDKELLLLSGHDPYLDQRDRYILQSDKIKQRTIWKLVGNPGAIVYRGEIIGIWTHKKTNMNMDIKITLWQDSPQLQEQLTVLVKAYAEFNQCSFNHISFA